MQQLAVQSLSGNVQLPAAAIIEALSLSRATHYRHKLSAAQPDPDIQLRDHIQRLAPAWPYYEQAQKLAREMGTPENPTKLGNLLVDAEEAARSGDLKTAIKKYAEAKRMEPLLAP
jgi:hypothetical protein